MNLPGAGRCLAVWGAGTATAAGVARVLVPAVDDLAAALHAAALPGGFERLLVAGCAGVGLLGVCWLWLAMTVVVTEALRAGSATVPAGRHGVVPTRFRACVLTACGAVVLGATLQPAAAAPGSGSDGSDAGAGSGIGTGTVALLHGLPLPDRAVDQRLRTPAPVPAATPAGQRPAAPVTAVVVRAGDTLWALATADLARGSQHPATDAEVAAHVVGLHRANRAVIGGDPDLILPGQRLQLPPTP